MNYNVHTLLDLAHLGVEAILFHGHAVLYAKQIKTKQNKTKQNIPIQNKTKQNKTKQNKTKQNVQTCSILSAALSFLKRGMGGALKACCATRPGRKVAGAE